MNGGGRVKGLARSETRAHHDLSTEHVDTHPSRTPEGGYSPMTARSLVEPANVVKAHRLLRDTRHVESSSTGLLKVTVTRNPVERATSV